MWYKRGKFLIYSSGDQNTRQQGGNDHGKLGLLDLRIMLQNALQRYRKTFKYLTIVVLNADWATFSWHCGFFSISRLANLLESYQ